MGAPFRCGPTVGRTGPVAGFAAIRGRGSSARRVRLPVSRNRRVGHTPVSHLADAFPVLAIRDDTGRHRSPQAWNDARPSPERDGLVEPELRVAVPQEHGRQARSHGASPTTQDARRCRRTPGAVDTLRGRLRLALDRLHECIRTCLDPSFGTISRVRHARRPRGRHLQAGVQALCRERHGRGAGQRASHHPGRRCDSNSAPLAHTSPAPF